MLIFTLPSRYCLPDVLGREAWSRFGTLPPGYRRVQAICDYVHGHLTFSYGSSTPQSTAADVHASGYGVCRDFAHLVVALLRAVNVPARVVAVYAPGLYPMDFHAVAEAFVDGQWRVVDATLLAPRQSLVRIATGGDAADTAFLVNHKGAITLNSMYVTAIVDGLLPRDSIDQLVSIR